MVKGPDYSQKVRKFMFKTFGGNNEALQEAMKWRDQEEDKLKERQNGQIVLQSQFEDQQKKLRELQEADYRRLKEKERLELLAIEKQKEKDWIASEHALDQKLWKRDFTDNYDYWIQKYPVEAATPEGKNLIKDGYIALGMFGMECIPSVDAIQKGYLQRKKLNELIEQGVKLKIKDVFRKDQIILV
jgi:hypothetical protein